MAEMKFDHDLYLATLRTADSVGMSVVSEDDLARSLAILHVAGNNEMMTHSYKFMAEVKFAQEKYHIRGGEKPDKDFCRLIKEYMKELEDHEYLHNTYPKWAYDFMQKRYGVKLF